MKNGGEPTEREQNAENDRAERSLRYSLYDGIFSSGMTGFTQEYFVPFLLLIGGTARHVGLLGALPNLVASLIQFKSADLVDSLRSRKRVMTAFALLQAIAVLGIALIAYLHESHVHLLIAAVTLFVSAGAIATTVWGSLMADLVAVGRRGEYFGWRNKVLGFVTVAAAFLAGSILQRTKDIDPFLGFAAIFGAAFVFRIFSWQYLGRMHEPALEHRRGDRAGVAAFIRTMKESNYARFVLYVSLFMFSVNLSAPFFAVLMLRDLGFSYLTYTLIVMTATLTVYALSKRWGMHADRVGNAKVVVLTSRLIAFIPLFWLVNRHPLFLVLVQLYAGFLWAGLNLSISNFVYDSCGPETRTRCIAYFNLFNGLCLCAGALAGGFLVQVLPELLGHRILTLLVISVALRCIVVFVLPLRFEEVRESEPVTGGALLLSMLGIRPILESNRR